MQDTYDNSMQKSAALCDALKSLMEQATAWLFSLILPCSLMLS